MAHLRIALGLTLAFLALAFGPWGVDGWRAPDLADAIRLVLMGVYGLGAIAGLFGPKILRDAAFGLALFGGADFLFGEIRQAPFLATRFLADALYTLVYNAARGTHLTWAEEVGRAINPAITAVWLKRSAVLQASGLPFGLVGAVLAVVLGRRAPLRPWSRGANFAALAAGLAGMAACFVLPGWWASFLAFHAVFGLFLAAALGARFGPLDARARLFGFALIGGIVFVFGAYRYIPMPSLTSWLEDPVGMLLARLGTWIAPADDPDGGLLLVGSYVLADHLTTPNPLRSRICLASLFSAIPVGLAGAGLAVGVSRLRSVTRFLRLSGTMWAMLAVACSAVVLMAFRSARPPYPWTWMWIEHRMIFGLGLAAAFRARFGSPRGRPFYTGFALFGLANMAIVTMAMTLRLGLAIPIIRFTSWIYEAIHVDATGTTYVACSTISLVAALVGGGLCALMIPSRREPIHPE